LQQKVSAFTQEKMYEAEMGEICLKLIISYKISYS